MNFVSRIAFIAIPIMINLCICSRHTKGFSILATQHPSRRRILCWSRSKLHSSKEAQTDDDEWETVKDVELLADNVEYSDESDDWIPDSVKAKQRKEQSRVYAEKVVEETEHEQHQQEPEQNQQNPDVSNRPSAYTEEEEELIAAMGGKRISQREPGFLGDSTLQEIATDYSVPISYLADVLCMWGVPPPIHVHDRLGDLVTGEQAFAIVEAVNSLDVAALYDRYSNSNLIQLCEEWGIDLQGAFEMCMKEGWSLPFGVQTCLRVEQEESLIEALADPLAFVDDDEDYQAEDGEEYSDAFN